MRVRVDEARCTGHGRCYVVAPTVFSADADGYNAAIGEEVDIADADAELARKAISSCPERALTILGE
jgi:ferredoxin